MYVFDKILYVILYAVTRFVKLIFIIGVITLIIGIGIIAFTIAISTGPIAIFPSLLFLIFGIGTILYALGYLISDTLLIIYLRSNSLHPKTLSEDILEHTPVFNTFYKAFQINKNPFKNMKEYSY